jgi:formylglycine-generating enzyme required for sulfatase activity
MKNLTVLSSEHGVVKMRFKLPSIFVTCVLSGVFCLLLIAAETVDEGKVIIRSVPLKCKVSFLDRDMDKADYQMIIEEVPGGTHSIVFETGDETIEADIDIQAVITYLVHGSFNEHKIFVTPNIHTGKDGAPMVLIPEGEFQMGSDTGEPDELPVHEVYLDAFYVDVYEVTNALYKNFLDATGHEPPRYWADPRANTPDQPVVGVTWDDARAYCKWAGKRLPTEAEWEKASRGGLVGKKYPWGDVDNVTAPRAHQGVSGAYAVGSFAPNGYGLYDMVRNAWEWCADWYGEDYYAESVGQNPSGPASGDARVLRGGSWFAGISDPLRVSYRYSFDPEHTSNLIGFRCVATP